MIPDDQRQPVLHASHDYLMRLIDGWVAAGPTARRHPAV
jgi:hypothetical protein